MLDTIGDYAKRQSFDLGDRILPSAAISEHAGQIDDLRKPAAVILALDFDFKRHRWEYTTVAQQRGEAITSGKKGVR